MKHRNALLLAGALLLGPLLTGPPVFAQDNDCSLTPPTAFEPGDQVRVNDALGRGRLYIYAEPTSDSVTLARLMPGDEIELLADAPVCNGGQAFWRVPAPNDRSGWLPAAVELDTNPANLHTLVLEPTRDPNVLFEDDFSTEDYWAEVFSDTFRAEYVPSRERFSIGLLDPGLNLWYWSRADEIQHVADFTAAIDIIPMTEAGLAGLGFHGSRDAYTYVLINPREQTFQLFQLANGTYTTLIDAVESNAILPFPMTNRLQVTVSGSQIALYANDLPLALYPADAPGQGQIGLFAYSPPDSSADPEITLFNYDNLRVTLPQPIDPTAFPPLPEPICEAQAARNVNVRSGPGEGYTVLGSLAPSTPLEVTGRSGQWYAVTLNGREGWVAGWIVTLDGACNDLPTQQPVAPVQAQQQPADQPAQANNAQDNSTQPDQPAQQQNDAPANPPPADQPPADQPPQQCSLTIVNGSGSYLTDIRLGQGSEWIGVAGGLDNGGSITVTVPCGQYYDCSGLLDGTAWWWDASGNIPANGTCRISTPS